MDTNNSDPWVEKRLAELDPGRDWQPDISRGLARFEERRAKAGNRKRRWGWLVAGAVAAGLPLMAFPSTRAFAQRCVSACTSQSSWVHDIFLRNPAPSSTFVKPGDRRMAPDFVLDDASGQPVRLSELRGKVVLLNFWATWCAPCRIEIPWFIEFEKTHKSRGFATLGVSLDEDGWGAVKPYIEQHKINYRVMIGNDGLAEQYGAASLPTTLIIDRSGRIAATHVGLCGKNEYDADIKAVLDEQ
jgi:cytochrome c biogenesis protein CcmG/thiol:disulfide interchange protein DsbE